MTGVLLLGFSGRVGTDVGANVGMDVGLDVGTGVVALLSPPDPKRLSFALWSSHPERKIVMPARMAERLSMLMEAQLILAIALIYANSNNINLY
jgi:hypothetical protein